MSIRLEDNQEKDMVLKIFRVARLVTGGAVLAVASFGTFAPLFGFNAGTEADLIAAVIGGGVTSAVLAKMSLLA